MITLYEDPWTMRTSLALCDQESEIKDWAQTYPYQNILKCLDESELPHFQKSRRIFVPLAYTDFCRSHNGKYFRLSIKNGRFDLACRRSSYQSQSLPCFLVLQIFLVENIKYKFYKLAKMIAVEKDSIGMWIVLLCLLGFVSSHLTPGYFHPLSQRRENHKENINVLLSWIAENVLLFWVWFNGEILSLVKWNLCAEKLTLRSIHPYFANENPYWFVTSTFQIIFYSCFEIFNWEFLTFSVLEFLSI